MDIWSQVMKQLVMLAECAIILLGFGGCQGRAVKSSGTKVIPPDIAGTWKAKNSPWKIVLSPDGTVSSAVIPMGEVELKPNQTTRMGMKDGQFSTYKAGDFDVEYIPAARELFVSIELEDMHIVYLDNVIDGNSIDRFIGTVSEDGKVWVADWINIFDYGPRFPQDANDIYAEQLIFEKLED